jgi:hypothetical protein
MPATQILPWPLVESRPTAIFPVRTLQQLLRARNHPVAIDGIFGPDTEAAVKAFQQSKGLAADGIVGPLTWTKLIVQVQTGSTGDAVRGVQEVMKFHDQSDGEGPPIHSTASSARSRTSGFEASRTPSTSTSTASSARSPGARWSAGCSPADADVDNTARQASPGRGPPSDAGARSSPGPATS